MNTLMVYILHRFFVEKILVGRREIRNRTLLDRIFFDFTVNFRKHYYCNENKLLTLFEYSHTFELLSFKI